MFDLFENKEEGNKKKLKELLIRNERLDQEIADFLEELEVRPEQLTAFVNNKENFTEKNWKELCEEREKLEQKLQVAIESKQSATETRKKYKELANLTRS